MIDHGPAQREADPVEGIRSQRSKHHHPYAGDDETRERERAPAASVRT